VHSCIWVTRSQINQANSYSTPTTTYSFCIHLLFQDHTFSIQQRSVYINRNIQQTTISRANARWFTKLVYTVKEPQRFAEQKLCWKLSRNRLQQRTGHSWPMGLDPSHNQGELKIFTNLTRHFCGIGHTPTVAVSSLSCAEESMVIIWTPETKFLTKHTHTRPKTQQTLFCQRHRDQPTSTWFVCTPLNPSADDAGSPSLPQSRDGLLPSAESSEMHSHVTAFLNMSNNTSISALG